MNNKNLQQTSSPPCTLSTKHLNIWRALSPTASIGYLNYFVFTTIIAHVNNHSNSHIHVFSVRKRVVTTSFYNNRSIKQPEAPETLGIALSAAQPIFASR